MLSNPLLFLSLALSTSVVATPQNPKDFATYTISNPTSLAAYSSRLATYEASLTKDPRYSSILSVGQTAFPKTLDWDGLNKPFTTEAWYRAMPTEVASWWLSVAGEQRRLITATGTEGGAKATGTAKGEASGRDGVVKGMVAGLGVAVGIVGFVL